MSFTKQHLRYFTLSTFMALTAFGVIAQDRVAEQAITHTADDDSLQWGPCPEFLPEGCRLAVLHGDPAQPNVDVLLELPGRSSLPLHWHTSAERMILIEGELHVTYEGQAPAVLVPGTYAYGPAGKRHSGECASTEACVLFIAFEAPLDAVPMDE